MAQLWSDGDVVGGRYRLMRLVGRDRSGELWEAHDDQQMEVVHLRLLSERLRAEPLVVMRFRREAAIAARLEHSALVVPRELVEDGPTLALIYARPGEETLQDRLRRGAMSAAEAAHLMEPVVQGLEHAHRRGVIHRNLSPEKIWVGDDGAKVTGFGGARVLDMVGLTTQSVAFGVSYYRPPEQVLKGEADRRTDVWAVGMMLLELVTGQTPVEAGGPRAMVEALEALDLEEVLGPAAETGVGRAVRGALQLERSRRLPSMGELRRIMAGAEMQIDLDTEERLPCWNCEEPRLMTMHFCVHCGAGPLVQYPGEGPVSLVVPKVRTEDPTEEGQRFKGRRGWSDLFGRDFQRGLDGQRRVLLEERLERAGAKLTPKKRKRLSKSPILIANRLTAEDAHRLKTFLESGEAQELEVEMEQDRPPRLREKLKAISNPDEMVTAEVPLLYHHLESEAPAHWWLTGVTWSSPIIFVILGFFAAVFTLISIWGVLYFLLEPPTTLHPSDAAVVAGFIFLSAPLWLSMIFSSLRHSRSVAQEFQRAAIEPEEDMLAWMRWRDTALDLGRRDDRELLEELFRVAWPQFEVAGSVRRQHLWMLLEKAREQMVALSEAPRERQWQSLQVAWEGLQARRAQGDQDVDELRRDLLAQMERHEEAAERAELARARVEAVIEHFRGASGGLEEDSRGSDARADQQLEISEQELQEVLDDLGILSSLHELFRSVDDEFYFEIDEAGREQVDLGGLELPERFDVIRKLDEGGMASIYLAYDHYREEEVALKIAHPDLRGHGGVSDLMRREFEAARRVRHPGLVAIYEHLRVEGGDILVMEVAPGLDLKTMIRWRGALPVGEVRRLGEQILDALESAHRRGVIHGDIKPANIMVGDDGQVKLVDFGLARMEYLARDEALEARLGTPGYAAPEILEGGVVDERADIYGVGLTLYESLTGELPFGPGRGALADEEWGAIEEGLAMGEVLRRAASPQRRARFRSAAQMQQVLSGELEQRASALASRGERCLGCGEVRSSTLARCFGCGHRRRVMKKAGRLTGHQVVVTHGADCDGQPVRVLNGEELARIQQLVEGVQGLSLEEHYTKAMGDLPTLLTPPLEEESAQAMVAELERGGIKARKLAAWGPSRLHQLGHAIPAVVGASKPFFALLPVYLGVALMIATVIMERLRGYDFLDQYTFLLLAVTVGLFAVPILLVRREFLPRLRPATAFDREGGEVTSAEEPQWVEEAYEITCGAVSERSRTMIAELVEGALELHQRWEESEIFRELQQPLDRLVRRSLLLAQEMVEAEGVASAVDVVRVMQKIERLEGSLDGLNTEDEEAAGGRIDRLRRRLDEREANHRRAVQIGSSLLAVNARLRQLAQGVEVEDEQQDQLEEVVLGEVEVILDTGAAEAAPVSRESAQSSGAGPTTIEIGSVPSSL